MSADRFSELMPWYVNGSISAEDRAWVDSYIASNPEAKSELAFYQSLQKRMRDNAPAVPATIGLDKAMRLIRGDQPSFAEKLQSFFGGFGMRPAVAFAAVALFTIQAGVIYTMMQQAHDDTDQIRALKAKVVTEGEMLKLNLTPDAKEADIRFLLLSVQGDLAAGPSQLGDYYVRVPAGTQAAALAKLQGNPIVQAVALAPGVPPRE